MIRCFALTVLSIASVGAIAQTTPGASTSAPSTSALPTLAPQSPFYVGIQQAFTNESNVLYAPDGAPKVSDWFSTTTLRAGVNQPISRQRLYADGELRYNAYGSRDQLNNGGYSFNAGIDWATIERLSGNLSAHADRSRTRLVTTSFVPQFTAPVSGTEAATNIERSEELRAVARLGGPTALTFELGGNYRQTNFTASQLADREYQRTGAHAAALYRLSSATNVGLGVAGARTKYARDQANRSEVYFQGGWTPSALSDVQLRLGATQVEYDVITAQNFKGVTGTLVWNWRPTAKIAVSTSAARDVGQDIGFTRLVPGQGVSAADFSTLTNIVGVRATYEATSKILVDAGASWTRRNITNVFAQSQGLGGNRGTDTSGVLSLGARWMPTRAISLGCQVSREQRDSKTTSVSAQYTNDLFGCFGAFTIY